jgi:hypothetical protein
MAIWNLGAAFVCTSCLSRGVWRRCQLCKRETIDLRQGTELLQQRWSAWPAFAAGRALYSPRVVPSFRVLKWITSLATIATALAPVFGPWAKSGHPPEAMELGLSLGVGLLVSPIVFIFYAGYFLFIAHVFRGMSAGLGFLADVMPIGRSRFQITSKISRLLSRPLIPQLEVIDPGELTDGKSRGVLIEPLTLDFIRDSWGLVERFDVIPSAHAKVKLDGGEETVVSLDHGGVAYDQAMSRRSDFAGALPSWLHAPGRDGVRFRREFPAGTRVVFARGRQDNDDARVVLSLG